MGVSLRGGKLALAWGSGRRRLRQRPHGKLWSGVPQGQGPQDSQRAPSRLWVSAGESHVPRAYTAGFGHHQVIVRPLNLLLPQSYTGHDQQTANEQGSVLSTSTGSSSYQDS